MSYLTQRRSLTTLAILGPRSTPDSARHVYSLHHERSFHACLPSQVRHGPEWRESAHFWGAEGPWRNEASSCLWDPITPTATRRAASSDESLWRCLFRQSSRGRSAVSIRRWPTKHESLSERCDHPSDIINANLWCTAGRRDSGNRRWYTEHQAISSTGQTRLPIHAGETVEDQLSP